MVNRDCACRGDAAVGVALWARVLLPQLLCCPLPSPGSSPSAASPPRLGKEAAERALQFLDGILAREKPAVEPPERDERGHIKWHPGTVGAGIPEGPLVRFQKEIMLRRFSPSTHAYMLPFLQCLMHEAAAGDRTMGKCDPISVMHLRSRFCCHR